MTFELTQLNALRWTVSDPDRHIELVSLGGGSDGTRHFRLISQFDKKDFSGRSDIQLLDAGNAKSKDAAVVTWDIRIADRPFRFGPGDRDTAQLHCLLTEAFDLYGSSGHRTPNSSVVVSFS